MIKMIDDSEYEYDVDLDFDSNSFETELTKLLNCHCKDTTTNTPDFILAKYLMDTIQALESLNKHRDTWHGHSTEDSETNPSSLHLCPECHCEPSLVTSPIGYHYECCNVMGGFPPAPTEQDAKDQWNNNRR